MQPNFNLKKLPLIAFLTLLNAGEDVNLQIRSARVLEKAKKL